MSFAIAIGRFYEDLAERLERSARETFARAGHADVQVFDVPGAFELPLAASYAAASGRFLGVACLGAVIRGETSHYDHVCAEAARGIVAGFGIRSYLMGLNAVADLIADERSAAAKK